MANYDLQKFNDFPNFRPCFTPSQMLTIGIAGGTTFNRLTQWQHPDYITRLSFFTNNRKAEYSPNLNYTRVAIPKKIMGKTSLMHIPQHGNFANWYTAFYYGSRSIHDAEMIAHWEQALKTIWEAIKLGPQVHWYNKENSPNLTQFLLEYGWDRAVEYPTGLVVGHTILEQG